MKRYVRSGTLNRVVEKIQKAKRDLSRFDKEKVDYVRECQDEIAKAISEQYSGSEDLDYPVGSKLSEIKRDYLVGALEDDFMTEEEFDAIFDALDLISLEMAHSYA